MKEHAIMLDTPEQAARFNRRLINKCVRAYALGGPVKPEALDVVIIGAGATGTELSAELHGTARGLVAFGLDNIDPDKDIKITLIEASDRVVPALPPRISQATEETLKRLNVDVRTNARVTGVTDKGVQLANGEFIPSELVVWSAGVKGPEVLKNLDGLEVSRANTLVVTPTLQTTLDPDVFAIGDCAWLVPPGETHAIPPRAQAAHQMYRISCVSSCTVSTERNSSRSSIAISGLSFRSDITRPSAASWFRDRPQDADRGHVRKAHVSLALQDARSRPAWLREGRARYSVPPSHAPHRAACEAALKRSRELFGSPSAIRRPQRVRVTKRDGVNEAFR